MRGSYSPSRLMRMPEDGPTGKTQHTLSYTLTPSYIPTRPLVFQHTLSYTNIPSHALSYTNTPSHIPTHTLPIHVFSIHTPNIVSHDISSPLLLTPALISTSPCNHLPFSSFFVFPDVDVLQLKGRKDLMMCQ